MTKRNGKSLKEMQKRTIASVLMLVGMLFMLCGCGNEFPSKAESEPYNITIVGIGHRHAYNMVIENYIDEIYKLCCDGGKIVVITTGGSSEVVINREYAAIDKSLPKARQEIEIKRVAEDIIRRIKACKVKAEEVDVLASLIIAARTDADVIIVNDSGLDTVGDLDMMKGYLNDNCSDTPESIALMLKDMNKLPDFSGKTFIWYGCGDTCGGQYVSFRARERLKDIWKAVIELAGGKVTFMDNLPSSVEYDGPYVSLIDISEGEVGEATLEERVKTEVYSESDRNELTFVSNSDEFLYGELAESLLCAKAYELNNEYSDRSIVVIGTTATGNIQNAQILSEKRANKVKEVLISNNVDPSRIVCYGFGCTFSDRVDDVDEDGFLIESKAAQNRLVIIGDSQDEEILELLEKNQ